MIIASTICLIIAALFGLQIWFSSFLEGIVLDPNRTLARVLPPLVAGLVLRLLPVIDHFAR